MKPALALLALVALASGVWFALNEAPPAQAKSTKLPAKGEQIPARSGTVEVSAADFHKLRRRVIKLEKQVDQLRAALRSVAPPEAPAQARAKGVAEVAEALDESGPEGNKIKKLVRSEFEHLREQRWAEREGRMVDRLERRFERYVEESGIDEDSQKTIGGLLRAEQGKRFEIIREARKTMAWPEAREKMEAIGAETDAKAAESLSEAQLSTYKEARDDGLGRMRGPWNRGRRGKR